MNKEDFMDQQIMIASEDVGTIMENGNTKNALNETGTNITWCGYDVAVKRFLSFTEMMKFVKGVVDGCFATDGGSYIPEVRDMYFRCSIVEFYTNIKLPDPIEEKNQIVYGTNIIDLILQNIDMGQFRAIMDSIEKKVDYLVDTNLKRVEDKAEAFLGEIIEQCEELSKAFSGVDAKEMAAFIKSVTEMNFDEKAVISAAADMKRKMKQEQTNELKVVK